MINNRSPIGYVVEIEDRQVTLNISDQHRGQVAGHYKGVSPVTDIGGHLVIDGGSRLLILRISGLNFSEPREIHNYKKTPGRTDGEPLRHLRGYVIGWIEKKDGLTIFTNDSLATPALGSQVYPIRQDEMAAVIGGRDLTAPILLGTEHRTGGSIRVGLNQLLAQHVAVLGSSGQGKSCFTASILQQLCSLPSSKIVIFDINGEYDRAFKKSEAAISAGDEGSRLGPGEYKHTTIGRTANGANQLRINYYALGRQGLHRLLIPSEKTQRPALSFAIDGLSKVIWHNGQGGASLFGGTSACLYDDCRQANVADAHTAIEAIRSGVAATASAWPSMKALAALVADSHCISQNSRNTLERNAFNYGNVGPLITRIRRLIDDEMFKAVVNVDGGSPCTANGTLDWVAESEHLVNTIFGKNDDTWRVHVVNLRQVPQDLMPLVLGSLLELYAHVLFRRGQGATRPTLLVLEEAHHYLRPIGDKEEGRENALAYERLAKEGRKFGLSLWLSTQRPSEVSPTVLSQCGTWISFRLNSEQDLRVISSACEWSDPREVKRISGLPRQHAIALGVGVSLPTCMRAPTADPRPHSFDGGFDAWEEVPAEIPPF